jgi:hypothetical protein
MAKNTSRGRRWLTARAPRRTAQGRRVRSLFRAFMTKLTPGDPLHQAAAMRAAELIVASEDMRARLLAGDIAAEEAVTRLENAARRAQQELDPLIPKPLTWLERQEIERQQEETNGEDQDQEDEAA